MKKKIIVSIFFVIIFISLILLGLFIYTTKNYNHVKIDKENLGINEDMKNNQITQQVTIVNKKGEEEEREEIVDISGIVNIALFGLDRRTKDESSTRSDSIMVATINFDTKEIKLTSFMRDMLVDIEGHGKDKLNHAYAYGGPELTIKTLNQNFDLNIKDYVAVDFLMLEEIINIFDGVEIEVEEDEVPLINSYMAEVAYKNNLTYTELENYGLQKLNGAQAVAYARIRYVGNGDYERTERQRIVLSAIIDKSSSISIKDVPLLTSSILKNIETSISEFSAINLGKNYLLGNFGSVQTERIPRDGSFTSGIQPNGLWAMKVNFEKEIDFLKGWFYGIETEEYLKYKESHPLIENTKKSSTDDDTIDTLSIQQPLISELYIISPLKKEPIYFKLMNQ